MNKNRILNNLLATTFICGAIGFAAAPAYAQDTPEDDQATAGGPIEGSPDTSSADADPDAQEEGDIIVTGTRIPQPNLNSASPITVLNNQDVKLQGTARTEDIINSLPQSFAAQGSNISNGATGTATVNLRGLGSVRTLVLVNGRRLMPGDPRSPVPDINFIPALAVDRIDVLTGGASSVYGADAVAGVVNFIMDTDFEGIRLDAQYSFFDHVNNDNPGGIRQANAARGFAVPNGHRADGGTIDASFLIGAGFDDGRGHVTAYATYRKQNQVLQRDRDYSFCATANLAAPNTTDGRLFNCGGSGTSANGTFQQFNPNTFALIDVFQVGPNRTFISGSTPFNFAPYNFYQRPDERYTFGAFANYEISNALKPYLEVMFMDDRSVAQIAPSGNFGNTTTLNCDNPLLSAQQRARICAPGKTFVDPADGVTKAVVLTLRRNVEGGGRRDDLQHTDYRIVAGMRGDLGAGFSYDASYQYGRVVFAQTYFNDFSITRVGRALDVVTGPGGVPTCRSVITGVDPNCVPYDIFGTGTVTQAALDYLQTPGFSRGNTQETVASGSITAELGEHGVQSPWAETGVAVNVGAEYRKERLEFNTDTAFTTGDLAGQGGATIGVTGEFDVRELFTEVQIPLITDRPFFEQLEFRAGYRYSKYNVANNSFSTDTYKFEAEWAPVRDIRFRGSYNRAVRAPNIVELFSAQAVGLAGSTDPCAGVVDNNPATVSPTATAAQCALTGVSAAQYGFISDNPAEQYNGLLGGNPDLAPETADSYTLGVVLQPRFLPRFALTVDAFDIKVDDTIGTIGTDVIINQCIATGDPFFCSRIHRDQFGSLWLTPNGFITDTNSNVGRLETRGIDVNASYTQPIGGLGSVAFSFVGTYLDKLIVEPLIGVVRYDCAGFFGSSCGTPNPEWRHKFRVSYTHPSGIGLSAQWRHFSAVDNDVLSDDPDISGTIGVGSQHIKAQNYLDLVLTARIGDHYSFRLGANNILDRIPPTLVTPAPFGNGNTYPQVYDALGRYVFAGVTLDF
ncbi:MAG TPA: TonB-dependent receptor [Allosphingosinicella sp.]|nr:TonB-dependent receptor [Allosphingosinicella sp.]